MRELFKCASSKLGSAPSPKLCASRPLPASPLGWLMAPHAGMSPGLGPPAPVPVLTFPARQAHPDLPRAQGQNLCLSSSSLHGPSPKPFRPAPLPEETYHKDPHWTTTGIPHRSEVWRDGGPALRAQTELPNVHHSPGLPALDLSRQVPPCCNRELTGPPPGLTPRSRWWHPAHASVHEPCRVPPPRGSGPAGRACWVTGLGGGPAVLGVCILLSQGMSWIQVPTEVPNRGE